MTNHEPKKLMSYTLTLHITLLGVHTQRRSACDHGSWRTRLPARSPPNVGRHRSRKAVRVRLLSQQQSHLRFFHQPESVNREKRLERTVLCCGTRVQGDNRDHVCCEPAFDWLTKPMTFSRARSMKMMSGTLKYQSDNGPSCVCHWLVREGHTTS